VSERFDANLPAWLEWQRAPWGRLFYTVAQANLQRHLGDRPLRVLDVAGGNGPDALVLARLGHEVTLVDFSPGMLAEARAGAAAQGLAERISLVQADALDLPVQFPAPEFDLVLCHNLLAYVDDVGAALRAITQPLRPGGLLSVIGANRFSEPYRAAIKLQDLEEALAQLEETHLARGIFGGHRNLLAGEDVIRLLETAGFQVEGRYGVRCLCDYLANDELKFVPAAYQALERLELAMTDRYPYYLIARFFQVIARK
jgi:S-adenosylmethionine-dependent methyltransferase